jgi:hypothetical protein
LFFFFFFFSPGPQPPAPPRDTRKDDNLVTIQAVKESGWAVGGSRWLSALPCPESRSLWLGCGVWRTRRSRDLPGTQWSEGREEGGNQSEVRSLPAGVAETEDEVAWGPTPSD